MAGGPKYSSQGHKRLTAIAKRKSRLGDLEDFNMLLERNKYPKCVGKTFFEDCPEKVEDEKKTPSQCKTCPQYEIPAFSVRDRILALQREIRKS